MVSFYTNGDSKSQDTKSRYLTEISDHLAQAGYFELCPLIRANILRSIRPMLAIVGLPPPGDEIKDTFYDCAWPHLALVYLIHSRAFSSRRNGSPPRVSIAGVEIDRRAERSGEMEPGKGETRREQLGDGRD
jgi:hypothetical protein